MKKIIAFLSICLFIYCNMKNKNSVKQEIVWHALKIQLLEGVDSTKIPYNGESNIIALDSLGNIVWQAESPKTHYEQYFNMSFDNDRRLLIANTGGGYRHLINPENGKIVEHFLVK
jgi:hypothetical protein